MAKKVVEETVREYDEKGNVVKETITRTEETETEKEIVKEYYPVYPYYPYYPSYPTPVKEWWIDYNPYYPFVTLTSGTVTIETGSGTTAQNIK